MDEAKIKVDDGDWFKVKCDFAKLEKQFADVKGANDGYLLLGDLIIPKCRLVYVQKL